MRSTQQERYKTRPPSLSVQCRFLVPKLLRYTLSGSYSNPPMWKSPLFLPVLHPGFGHTLGFDLVNYSWIYDPLLHVEDHRTSFVFYFQLMWYSISSSWSSPSSNVLLENLTQYSIVHSFVHQLLVSHPQAHLGKFDILPSLRRLGAVEVALPTSLSRGHHWHRTQPFDRFHLPKKRAYLPRFDYQLRAILIMIFAASKFIWSSLSYNS